LDGPAALVFSDGEFVGAKLDRNGLRPMRYTLTHDGLLIAGSETGLVDLEESRIAERQRLGPGEMILANPSTGSFCAGAISSSARHSPGPPRDPAVQSGGVRFRASTPVPQPKRVAGAAGWTEDQFKTLFSALVRGRKRTGAWATTRLLPFFRPFPDRSGLLQTALRSSHQPSH